MGLAKMRFAIFAFLLVGCASVGGDPRGSEELPRGNGHLVIVGGALDPGNDRIYGRILELVGEGGELGVLPTASGVWKESGPDNAARFDAHADHAVARVVPVHGELEGSADDARLAASIDALAGVFFTGGDQARIVAALRPGGRSTPVDRALLRLMERGGVIAGSSAGAAMMSDPMIYGGRSGRALRLGAAHAMDAVEPAGREVGVEIGAGMGFFPHGLVDQHFLERGRMGRLIVAMDSAGVPWGWGIPENRGIHADLGAGVVEVLGDGGLLLVDGRESQRVGADLIGLRVSLLGDGDRVDVPGGSVEVAAGCRRFVPPRRTGFSEPVLMEDEAFESRAIARALRRLGGPADAGVILRSEDFELLFERGPASRFHVGPNGSEAGTRVLGVELSIRARGR